MRFLFHKFFLSPAPARETDCKDRDAFALWLFSELRGLEGRRFGNATEKHAALEALFAPSGSYPPALYVRGCALVGLDRYRPECKELFRAAAEAGFVRAFAEHGAMLSDAGDRAGALAWFERGVEAGDAVACLALANATVDEDRAVALLLRGAAAGQSQCMRLASKALHRRGDRIGYMTLKARSVLASGGFLRHLSFLARVVLPLAAELRAEGAGASDRCCRELFAVGRALDGCDELASTNRPLPSRCVFVIDFYHLVAHRCRMAALAVLVSLAPLIGSDAARLVAEAVLATRHDAGPWWREGAPRKTPTASI